MLITTVSLSEHHRQGSKCEIKFNNALITTCTCLWQQQLWQIWLKMGRRQKRHSSVKMEMSGGGGGGGRGARQGWKLSEGRSQPRVTRVCPGVRARGTGGALAALQQWTCFNRTFMSKQECTWTELLKASHAALPCTYGHMQRPAWILLWGNDRRWPGLESAWLKRLQFKADTPAKETFLWFLLL